MKVFTNKEMYIWLLVNILSPIVAPLCFALFMNLIVKTGYDSWEMLVLLFNGGAYIFLSLFVLISLLPHFFDKSFEVNTSYRTVLFLYVLITLIVLLFTCFLYLSFLSLIQGEKAIPFKENLLISLIVTVLGIILAVIFKAKILSLQNGTGNISNEYQVPD